MLRMVCWQRYRELWCQYTSGRWHAALRGLSKCCCYGLGCAAMGRMRQGLTNAP